MIKIPKKEIFLNLFNIMYIKFYKILNIRSSIFYSKKLTLIYISNMYVRNKIVQNTI